MCIEMKSQKKKSLTPRGTGVPSEYVLADLYYSYSRTFGIAPRVESGSRPAVHGRTPAALPGRRFALCDRL